MNQYAEEDALQEQGTQGWLGHLTLLLRHSLGGLGCKLSFAFYVQPQIAVEALKRMREIEQPALPLSSGMGALVPTKGIEASGNEIDGLRWLKKRRCRCQKLEQIP